MMVLNIKYQLRDWWLTKTYWKKVGMAADGIDRSR